MNKLTMIIMVVLLVVSCSQNRDEKIIISVMGDVPRSEIENDLIQEHIRLHNEKSNAEFMFHVGDIKDGKSPCEEEVYDRVAGYLKRLTIPVFIVPGDNEWNDCSCPDSAWVLWEKYFLSFENNWKLSIDVQRQNVRKENFAFMTKGVLLIGLNLVGGRVHDEDEWEVRNKQCAAWVEDQFSKNREYVRAAVLFLQANPDAKHKTFMESFLKSAKEFSKPIIFIHGDGHEWIYEEEWLLPNITRIQVDKGGIAPPLKIVINSDGERIINYNRNQF
ncbi:MAG: metallophosphoesterase [Bacteroidetes bacterium]|nr:metallophosphoesterase [Bacteroidota bacterium]